MRRCHPSGTRKALSSLTLLLVGGCGASPAPQSVHDASSLAGSPTVQEAENLAPQAAAAAAGLVAEAKALSRDGQNEEAGVVGEQALAAYQEAFALVSAAKAQARLEQAEADVARSEKRLEELSRAQARAQREAEAFELRAKVALDQEQVEDVENLSPGRARARHQAARQLASEARMLCLAAQLVGAEAEALRKAGEELDKLETELGYGSVRQDMYPRAAEARNGCLFSLTLARRAEIQKAPDAAGSDRLLRELSETGLLFAFRDDRGVVVNLRPERSKTGSWDEATEKIVRLLAQTSKQNPSYPLLVVGHSAKRAESDSAEQAAKDFAQALNQAGADSVTVAAASANQPVVDPMVRGADEKNQRIEVVFVAPAR